MTYRQVKKWITLIGGVLGIITAILQVVASPKPLRDAYPPPSVLPSPTSSALQAPVVGNSQTESGSNSAPAPVIRVRRDGGRLAHPNGVKRSQGSNPSSSRSRRTPDLAIQLVQMLDRGDLNTYAAYVEKLSANPSKAKAALWSAHRLRPRSIELLREYAISCQTLYKKSRKPSDQNLVIAALQHLRNTMLSEHKELDHLWEVDESLRKLRASAVISVSKTAHSNL